MDEGLTKETVDESQSRRRELPDAAAVQRAHFDTVGSTAQMRVDRAFANRMAISARMVNGGAPAKLLDVGCSNGQITRMFRADALYGMDVSPRSVKEAASKGIEARIGNLEERFPFEDSMFDVVFAGETIEHTLRTDFFLSECNRILKSGGRLILTTPNANSVASLITMYILDLGPYMGARYRSPHVRDFSVRLLRYALSQNGFRMVETRGTWLGLPWPRAVSVLGRLDSLLAYYVPRLSAGLVICAEKVADANFDPSLEIQETLAL